MFPCIWLKRGLIEGLRSRGISAASRQGPLSLVVPAPP